MNDDLVFVKTPAGEDAVRDRTRLVQRNLRMVLILVDGLTNVSALKQKAGDPAMIETAMAELERIGLVESTESKGAKQANAVAEALAIADDGAQEVPEVVEESFHEVPTVDTVFEELSHAPIKITEEAVGRPSIQADAPPTSRGSEIRAEGWLIRLRNRWRNIQEERAYEKAYGTRRAEDDNITPAPAPRRLVGRHRLKLRTVVTVALLAGVMIAAARIFFFPYDSYRPGIETALSRIVGEPVSIERVNLEFSPIPRLMLRGIAVGDRSDLVADEIAITPNPGYIFGGRLVKSARVDGLHIGEKTLAKLDQWMLRENMQPYQTGPVAVQNLTVDLGWTRLVGLAGNLRPRDMNEVLFSGRFGDAKSDGRFDVVPTIGGLRLAVQSGPWVVPIDPPLGIDALDFLGRLENGRLTIEKMDMRAFDGMVSGSGLVTWGNNAKMSLDLALKHVSAAKLLGALQAPILVDGELAGQVQYASMKPLSAWLTSDAKAMATVSLVRGNLKRIDLPGALRAASQQTYSFRGGDTGFEDFAGKVAFEAGKATKVSDVRLSSGRLAATGQAVFPSGSGTIKGMASVEIRGSARAQRAAIAIEGNARDPELKIGSGTRPPSITAPRAQEKPGEEKQQ